MAFREIKYYFSEAFKSIWFNFIMTLSSVVTVTGCLILFGVFLLFSVNINYISEQIKDQCELQAFVDITYSESDAKGLRPKIEGVENIKSIEMETKDEAFENYKQMLGDDAVALEGLETEDFLRHSYKITLDDISQSQTVADEVAKVKGIADVRNRKDIMDKIFSFTSVVKTLSLYSMLLLSVISVLIISNTIKLAVHAREREIHIMKYVGATDWFIRWPFIIEGIIVGIIGAFLTLFVLSVCYGYVQKAVIDFLDIFELVSFKNIMNMLSLTLILFGALMGMAGSLLAVRKHLKV